MVHITEKNTKILVCCHKPCELPKDPLLLPIQVGKAISQYDLGITGDDTGDNISSKNKNFCELTAMYWAWKNIKKEYPDLEYIGLFHYRRFFDFNKSFYDSIILDESCVKSYHCDYSNLSSIFSNKKFIIGNKKHYPYNLQIDYCMHHISDDFIILKSTVHDMYPEYDRSFYYTFEVNNKLSHYNMFIASFEDFSQYCEWLFPLLFEIQRRTDLTGYSVQQARIYGFMAERLFNLYLYHNKIKVEYLPVIWYTNTNRQEYPGFSHIIQNIKNDISAHFYYLSAVKSLRTYLSNIKYYLHLDHFINNLKSHV